MAEKRELPKKAEVEKMITASVHPHGITSGPGSAAVAAHSPFDRSPKLKGDGRPAPTAKQGGDACEPERISRKRKQQVFLLLVTDRGFQKGLRQVLRRTHRTA